MSGAAADRLNQLRHISLIKSVERGFLSDFRRLAGTLELEIRRFQRTFVIELTRLELSGLSNLRCLALPAEHDIAGSD